MYAIIEVAGKQYKAEKDAYLKVDKLDNKVGDKIKFQPILTSDNKGKISVGNPVKGANVECEIIRQDKDAKILVFKYKAKKNERKRQGHRQPFTLLKVLSVKA